MKDKIELLHEKIKSLYGEELPLKVSEDIYNIIFKNDSIDDEYVFLNQIFTLSEYRITLSLLDKLYSSRMHNYGQKEELVYTFKSVKAGLIKNHRKRTPRGVFEQTDEKYEPIGIPNNENNIFVIKETIWDDHKDDKVHVSYTIFVFNKNNVFEKEKKLHDEYNIAELKKQVKGLSK